jgi:transposase
MNAGCGYTQGEVDERFFAWVQWQRRILVRWEYYPQNFLSFVQLACLLILFKRF